MSRRKQYELQHLKRYIVWVLEYEGNAVWYPEEFDTIEEAEDWVATNLDNTKGLYGKPEYVLSENVRDFVYDSRRPKK